jgi:hypothetical protein
MTKEGLFFPNHIVEILLLQIPAYIKTPDCDSVIRIRNQYSKYGNVEEFLVRSQDVRNGIAIRSLMPFRRGPNRREFPEDRPEIDSFRTKNVD